MNAVPEPQFGERLNDAQREAATYGQVDERRFKAGPLLIIAGAGTGKTNTLAHRVAHLLLSEVHPERIALMTFSRRAATEMLLRAESITARSMAARSARGTDATRRMWSGTFHSIANRLLREFASTIGMEPTFSVIDRGDSGDLIDIQRQALNLGKLGKRFPRKDTCLAIYSHRVNTRASLSDTLESAYPWCAEWESELNQLFRKYVAAKQAQQMLDYDDLLLYWHALVKEPSVAEVIGSRFDHVLVDEYQDTNTLQAEILLALKPDGDGLCVVGDDAQSIYSFRAATVDNILGFADQFTPKAGVVTLSDNYRSVQPVLDAANRLMAEGETGFDKNLRSTRGSGQKPKYVMVDDDHHQALYVVENILAKREEGTRLRDQAVLMRKSSDSDALEVELVRRDIPYVKYGGLKFLESAHVKDVLGILRFVDNPRNRIAAFRTLQLLPGVGPANAEKCLEALEAANYLHTALASVDMPAAAREEWETLRGLIIDLAAESTWAGQMTRVRHWYEPHIERLHGAAHVRAGDIEQLEAIALRHPSRDQFLTELTLDPPNASSDEAGDPLKDEDYLILSTVHSAKGQEWDTVSVLNVTDGTFPSEFSADDADQVEEERRLLYVAMTRAKYELSLVAPHKHYITEQRRFGAKHLYGARSRFMTDTLLECFESTSWPDGPGVAAKDASINNVKIDVGAKMRSMWDE